MHKTQPEPEFDLTVSAVAQRLGVAPDTLRTWARRYGLGPSGHEQGRHRKYSPIDVARLDLMKTYILNGVGPSKAAQMALEADVEAATLVPDARAQLRVVSESSESNVIALDSDKMRLRALRRAVGMLDGPSCDRIIGELIASHGVVYTWEKVLTPLLIEIGQQWENSAAGVEEEHVISQAITDQLRAVANSLSDCVNARPILLAAAPNELHVLPLYAIAAGLAEHGIASRILGARLPTDALVGAVKKIKPCAVLIWSQSRGTADMSVWESITQQRPPVATLATGPGWGSEVPPQFAGGNSLSSTLVLLARSVGTH